jgi:hypothetical protein
MPIIRFTGLPLLTKGQEEDLVQTCYRAVGGIANLELAEQTDRFVSVIISNDHLPKGQTPLIFIEVFGLLKKPRREESDRQSLAEGLVALTVNFFRQHFSGYEGLVECGVAPYVTERSGFAARKIEPVQVGA